MKTILRDRTLWFDGSIEVDEDQLISRMFHVKQVDCVSTLTNNINLFNIEHPHQHFSQKLEVANLDINWSIVILSDQEVVDRIYIEFEKEMQRGNFNQVDIKERFKRLQDELMLFERINKLKYLACLIFIIDTLKANGVVWNGRGSSAASYVLYLIGAHRVDSVKYGIDSIEFFKIKT